jgi:hypothetical protein
MTTTTHEVQVFDSPDPSRPAPSGVDVPEAEIYAVGGGMRFANDLTMEALAALRKCRRILGLPPVDLRAFGVRGMHDLGVYYAPGRPRIQTYRTMANIVVACARQGGPVGFFTYGSPIVGVRPTTMIRSEAAARGLRVHVCNAPSFLEALWSELGVDPFDGAAVWCAQRFVERPIAPCTAAVLLLAQATCVDVADAPVGRHVGNLARLRDRLLDHYPPEHPVAFMRSHSFSGAAARYEMHLRDLAEHTDPLADTLVVPPLAGSRRRPTPDFHQSVKSI